MELFDRLKKLFSRLKKSAIKSNSSANTKITNSFSSTINRVPVQPGEMFDGASHRLKEQKRISQQTNKQFFTSDLSTNEYLLTREVGCEPIGMVMGTSIYKVGFYGYFRGYRNQTGEVDVLTQAQLTVRELALTRMQQEASMLGAHGIIGVRLHQRQKGWGNLGMMEFTAIGTAIRIPNRPPTSTPFTSDLSGQEFWQLLQAGYYPKGLVFGACSYYVHSDRTTRNLTNPSLWMLWFSNVRQNQELIQYTQGFQDARELAIMRLTEDIKNLDAIGAVGMHIEKSEEVIVYQIGSIWGTLITLFILGLIGSLFFGTITGNSVLINTLWTLFNPVIKLIFSPALIGIIILIGIIQAIIFGRGNSGNSGTFSDLLTNFVIMGTAIVEDEKPLQNPVSKTLMFIPLTKS